MTKNEQWIVKNVFLLKYFESNFIFVIFLNNKFKFYLKINQ